MRLPRPSWEARPWAGLPKEAAWPLHRPGSQLGRHPSAAGAVDVVAQPEALASVKDDELPQELAGLDAKAREAKVKQLADERKALEEKATELAAERDAWRAKNVAEKEDSFDANVMKGVKEKAAKHGLTY